MDDARPRQILVVSTRSLFRAGVRALLAAVEVDRLVDAAHQKVVTRSLGQAYRSVAVVDLGSRWVRDATAGIPSLLRHPDGVEVIAVASSRTTDPEVPVKHPRLTLVASDVDLAVLIRAVERGFGDAPSGSLTQGVELTPRQRDVLLLVAGARSNKEISQQLSIAPGTVKRHLNDVFTVLEARSRIDAVNRARSLGLI
ncbi:response regulator transcription factor [Agromyces soli]|uniref:LuxR C-terminal-related transcriptional regulator n=1 Tax=Agromyces soli TaxID=659012 RepID=A0ABY4B0L0_9MICO|nr:LuxR C-terminal-related transcriptional regulator [Agromyces soli]UOE27603.1 LuxR C-terminal-related transcriptional regulator [Agromyces soli]